MSREGIKRGLFLLLPFLAGCASSPHASDAPPNILVIVADDLGYTDLGFLGSEIKTPNIDALARSGILLTNFLVAPACSPTRAMLLTGRDTHDVGYGTMAGEHDEAQRGAPGYEGYLTDRFDTVATRLAGRGYLTCMAGKWHLGMRPGQGPAARGFQRSFALLPGGASHFGDAYRLAYHPDPAPYREDGNPVSVPDDFFSSDFYTDKLIAYAREAKSSGRPFFSYASYTAPHWPLHAPDGWIDRYVGIYDDGWDALRERRFNAARRHGIARGPKPRRNWFVTPWEQMNPVERRREARNMEVYAAMVENLDHNIGRLLEALRASGQLDNTLVLFFSDNGPEGNAIGKFAKVRTWPEGLLNLSSERIGRRGSYAWLGPGWAAASVAPFRLFKAYPTQGGVRVPAIVSWPGRVRPGRSNAMMTVKDVAPTLTEVATGAPSRRSLLRPAPDPDHVMGWELFGRCAIQKGRWKIVRMAEPWGSGERWQLFDLEADPAEERDLAAAAPEKLAELRRAWDTYAKDHGVVMPTRDMGYANWRHP